MGINKLKPKQIGAILAFLHISGKDVFVALPTGYGKSIIFAFLPAIFNRMRGEIFIIKVEMVKTEWFSCIGEDNSLAVCISQLTSLEVDLTRKLKAGGLMLHMLVSNKSIDRGQRECWMEMWK